MNTRAQQSPDPRWKCICAYDGTTFAGWQSQVKGDAIQDVIEAQLSKLLGKPLRIHGSGRTDAGVHAHGQVFHFDANWKHGGEKLIAALTVGLPQTIQIKSAREVSHDFHARFSAIGKIYSYHLHLGDPDPFTRPYCWGRLHDLDFDVMESVAAMLQGKHDFRAFSAIGGAEKENTVRTLRRLDFVRKGRSVRITAEADGFLYKMVRRLVGAVVEAGQGKITPDRIQSLLLSAERPHDLRTAPPQGLFLEKVLY